MSKVDEVLLEALRALEAGWCQRSPAQRASGAFVHVESRYAARWSPIGALQLATSRRGLAWEGPIARAALRRVRDAIPTLTKAQREPLAMTPLCRIVADWNDAEERTHQQVLEVLETAVKSSPHEEEAA